MNMSKVEEMLATSGLSGILKKQEESDKTKRCIVTILALVGVVVAIAGIAYGVYRFFIKDDFDDFDDDLYFDDDDMEDFFDDDEEEEQTEE